ncbi:hypothetical protein B0T20DRAFT_511002 [Sordaria brevicollis]|uniref:Uncharacterized protein n=1 Tax=Sordaria brevicollis TaxID=83679 RepID=A0AAE0U383_SORBR|nr:hypothetical protein B0T20DRAFT_511002 [Sordaria brevicollis]
MTMTEQNGIDILCDAAGSDLLLSSYNYPIQHRDGQQAPSSSSSGAANSSSNTTNSNTTSTGSSSSTHPPPIATIPAGGPVPVPPTSSPNPLPHPLPDPTSTSTIHGHHQQQTQGPPRAKRPKTESAPLSASASTPTSNHVCQICKRVYERADHLTRHLRSHENARQYQCTRCPKRFNRADLLTRHETTHDRDNDGKGRTIIRRSDRAAEACLNCATSKAKCDDMKPCTRCRLKNLVCETSSKSKTPQYRTADGADAASVFTPSEHGTPNVASASMTPVDGTMPSSYGAFNAGYGMPPAKQPTSYGHAPQHPQQHQPQHHPYPPAQHHPDQGVEALNNLHYIAGSMMDVLPEQLLFPVHTNPTNPWYQDDDFNSWNINFDSFPVPQLDSYSQSPQSTAGTATTSSKPTAHRNTNHLDSARRHAAFKRSPWLWEPAAKQDYVRKDTEAGLRKLDEHAVTAAQSRLPTLPSTLMTKIKINSAARDRLFAIVMSQFKDPHRVPSFPSLELLNFLLQAHLVHDEYQCDSWIHSPTMNPAEMLPELLGAIVANGASFIAVPAIWQFGLSMHEIVRTRMSILFESQNENTRKLECLQAYSLHLAIGMWSGFKRKTELAEAFLQPLLIMMRRAGVYTAVVYTQADLPSVLPQQSDSPEVLERKWRTFVNRESYKRLAIHMFIHDVQTSLTLQTMPLLSFTELCFSLPSSRDLWKAPTAKAWRDLNFMKRKPPADRPMPRVNEIIHCPGLLDDFVDFVDIELVNTVVLHAFWGQISSYRYSLRFYQEPSTVTTMSGNYGHYSQRNFSNHRELLKSAQRELYNDLQDFATTVVYVHKSQPYTPVSQRRYPVPFPAPGGSNASSPNVHSPVSIANSNMPITLEMFMLALHVDLNQLQSFAGKAGEEEARRASAHFLNQEGNEPSGIGSGGGGWVRSTEARHAVWHAGQVFRAARALPPTGLMGFNAMAVYFASLTLWVYGLLGGPNPVSPVFPPQFGGGGGGGEHVMGGGRGGFGAGHHMQQPFNGASEINQDPRRSSVTVPVPSSHGYQQMSMPYQHQQQHPPQPHHQYQQPHLQPPPPDVHFAVVDGEETGAIRTFLQTGRGTPALAISSSQPSSSGPSNNNTKINPSTSHPTATATTSGNSPIVESLFANPTLPLQIACSIFRENFPSLSHSESEPLPPLVESLGTLLRDLGRGSTRGGSRAGSIADDDEEGQEDNSQDEDEDDGEEGRDRDRERERDRGRSRDLGRGGTISRDRGRREGGGEGEGYRRESKTGAVAAGSREEDRQRFERVSDGVAGREGPGKHDGRDGKVIRNDDVRLFGVGDGKL